MQTTYHGAADQDNCTRLGGTGMGMRNWRPGRRAQPAGGMTCSPCTCSMDQLNEKSTAPAGWHVGPV